MGISGPLFLLRAPQSPVHVAGFSTPRRSITGGEARFLHHLSLRGSKPVHPPIPPERPQADAGAKVTRPSLDWSSHVYSPPFTLTLDSGVGEANFPTKSGLPARPTFPSACLSFQHQPPQHTLLLFQTFLLYFLPDARPA